MIIAVIILAWLLVSTWITLIVVGIDDKWEADEWAGMAVACIFSPICFFVIRFIIKRAKKSKKKNTEKIYYAEDFE